ncbi:Conserved putative membrane protein [Rhodococcus opacus]|uniref:Conserved putative membrane protein n=1 Tax=Rhodococcus opacus TaxID=37919 RepID=A0A1B1KGA0_RHOOP|nr:Conserved putative membrane protein [Rhodococcus opacus]
MGLFTSATSLGTVIANTVVPWMINHYSWHASYHLFGAISVVTAVACYVIIRPGPVVNQRATNRDGKRPSATGSFLAAFSALAVGPMIGAVVLYFVDEDGGRITVADPALEPPDSTTH